MSNLSPQEKITTYKNLFKGTNDVFAVSWEKADKSASGYTLFCLNEWKSGICIKLKKEKWDNLFPIKTNWRQNYCGIGADFE